MATVLSGTSGALYYKPAGTVATFAETGVNATTDVITVAPFLGFKVGDPVQFRVVNVNTRVTGSGTLPGGISAATTYYVIGYTAATGALTISATLGGASVSISDDGTAVTPNAFEVAYAAAEAVGQVREWSFSVTREEIDVTTIGAAAGQYVPFRTYISGFADGEGTAWAAASGPADGALSPSAVALASFEGDHVNKDRSSPLLLPVPLPTQEGSQRVTSVQQ